MKEQQRKRSGRLDPKRLADEANLRFVGLAELLMRLVTWRRNARCSSKSDTDGRGLRARGEPPDRSGEPRPSRGGLSLDPRTLASLAEKVDRLLRRSDSTRVLDSCEQTDAQNSTVADESLRSKLKELFHQDAWHRLAAARWIRQHRRSGAISALEGVLSIEESNEVRGEIERALHVLTAL